MTSTETETVVPEWNPLAVREDVTVPLKVSGNRAAIVCRRWAGRERLAYEDALTERMMQLDATGEDTVKIGTLRLYAMTLTIVGSTGFPAAEDGRAFLSGDRADRERDLLAITDDATFAEIRDAAMRIQPLPSVDPGKGDDDDEGDEDPSLTPRTDQTPTAGADE